MLASSELMLVATTLLWFAPLLLLLCTTQGHPWGSPAQRAYRLVREASQVEVWTMIDRRRCLTLEYLFGNSMAAAALVQCFIRYLKLSVGR